MIPANDAQTNSISAADAHKRRYTAADKPDASCFHFSVRYDRRRHSFVAFLLPTNWAPPDNLTMHVVGCLQFNEFPTVQLLSTAIASCLRRCVAFGVVFSQSMQPHFQCYAYAENIHNYCSATI